MCPYGRAELPGEFGDFSPPPPRNFWRRLAIWSPLTVLLLLPGHSTAQQLSEAQQQRASNLAEKAVVQVSKGEYKKALRLFLEADLTFSQDPVVVYSIARCYEELGNCEGARQYFIKSLDHPLTLPPDARKKALDYVMATSHCEVELDDRLRAARDEANEYLLEGIERMLADDLDGGLSRFELAESVHPSPEARLRIAQAYVIKGDCGNLLTAVKAARSAWIPDEMKGFARHLDQEVDRCTAEVAEETETSDAETPVSRSEDKADVYEPQTEEVLVDEGAIVDDGEVVEVMAWVLGSVAVASFITAGVLVARWDTLQSEFDSETEKPIFDADKAERLKSDIETNDVLFNAFLWTGVALAAGSITLFIVDSLTQSSASIVNITPVVSPNGFGLSLDVPF